MSTLPSSSKLAGSLAAREGIKRAKPVLLEPVMKHEVTTPEEFMGDVIVDINSRRGRIESIWKISGWHQSSLLLLLLC